MKKKNKQTKQNKEHHWKNFLNNPSLMCSFLTTTETNLRTFSLVHLTVETPISGHRYNNKGWP